MAVFGVGSMVLTVVIIINIITNILMYTLGIYLVSGDKSAMSKKGFSKPRFDCFSYTPTAVLFEEGWRDEVREWFERSAKGDDWVQTRVGLLFYYECEDYQGFPTESEKKSMSTPRRENNAKRAWKDDDGKESRNSKAETSAKKRRGDQYGHPSKITL